MRTEVEERPSAGATLAPRLSYVICTAPRTGSTLLAQALVGVGRAGHPHEFFDIYPHNEQFWVKTLGVSDPRDYLGKVLAAGTSPNGIFGMKLLWHQSPALLAKARAAAPGLVGEAKALSDALLSSALGTPVRYVWLRRNNKLAQAISYFRASRSGAWSTAATATAGADPDFDFDAIAQFLRAVTGFDEAWTAFFRRNRLRVLAMTYENFIANYEASVLGVLKFLDIDPDGLAVPPPRLRRQADARSAEWERRFLEMARARSGAAARPAQQESRRPAAAAEEPEPSGDAPGPALIAYQLTPHAAPLVRAKPQREWMDATTARSAYRCLPMTIANQAGWVILNPHKIAVTWTGGAEPAALKIEFLEDSEGPRCAVSLFGAGVLTFTIGYLFRTPPGYNLYVRGPANMPRDGVAALSGLVETDWTEATFTMNWKLTRPRHPIVFERGEPIAMVSPVRRAEIERFRPELRNLSDDPELAALFHEWARSRARHNADLRLPTSKAHKDGWQRHYFRGVSIEHQPAREHQTKLALREFVDKRRPATAGPPPDAGSRPTDA